ncbi:MAG: hypothetical protein K2X81_26125, partial [Candidatus Obscuribacterales bacterium]|nr:hypothetical protein [Candidatus Obscuribacterales bacterium]
SPERFKGAMDSLKKAGVDTVAMECFREDQQKLVNDWLAAKPGTDDEKSLETDMRTYLDKTLNSGAEFTDKVMDFMKGAKDGGMKVLCIEPNGGKITYDGDGEDKERDGNWNKVTQNYLKENPESKVLILAGSGHFIHMRDQSVADKFAQDGIKTTDITPPSQYIDGEILLAR